MPMVPMFQGGVPQVQDAGRAGVAPLDIPQDRTDYQAVMRQAMKPVEDYANSVIKTLEVERARMIKAESDDAEMQVVGIINRHINDPESGYLTLRGKNAVDGYQPMMEKLTSDVNDVVGCLSPQVRDAIRSRVADRMMSAQTQAQRWNAGQTREYQVTSSKSRIESLISDAENHYADPEYLAKTYASVADECGYLGGLMGYDEATISQMVSESKDKVQAGRFATWAQDDPVSALGALMSSPKDAMGADTRRRLEGSIWQQAKGLLAAQLAAGHPLTGDKSELWHAIRSERTGIPLVDALPLARRAELFSAVWTKQKEAQSSSRQDLTAQEKNSLALISETGADSEMLGRDQYVAAYGESEGGRRYETYMATAETVAAIHGFRTMPVEAMDAVIEAAAPVRGSEDYADQVKRRDSLIKARDEVTKMRKADPVAYASATGDFGVKEINFDDANSLLSQIASRAQSAEDRARAYGTEAKIFSAPELSQLRTRLDALDAREKATLLAQIAAASGDEGVSVVRRQIGDKYETGFLLAADPAMRASGTAEAYFLGKAGIAEKQLKVGIVTAPSTGVPLRAEKLNGLIDNPAVRERVLDSITAVAAGKVMAGESSGTAMDQAMMEIVGDIQEYNGYKVALKGGMSLSDLENAVRSNVRNFERLKGVVAKLPDGTPLTGQEVAKILPTARLRMSSTGVDNDFDVVLANGQKLIQADGAPFTIRVVSFAR